MLAKALASAGAPWQGCVQREEKASMQFTASQNAQRFARGSPCSMMCPL